MSIRIRYRSTSDEVSERVISDVVVEPPNTIHALCHLRGEERTFVLNRIKHAVDLVSGKVIEDIWLYFGLPSLSHPPPTMPTFSEHPCPMTTEKAQQQRKADKQALFRRFKYEVIAEIYKAKLRYLFDEQCYHCKSPEGLELDHQYTAVLGWASCAGKYRHPLLTLQHGKGCEASAELPLTGSTCATRGDVACRIEDIRFHFRLYTVVVSSKRIFDFTWSRRRSCRSSSL